MKCAIYGIRDPDEKAHAYREFKKKFKDHVQGIGDYVTLLEEIRNFNWRYATFSILKGFFNFQGEGIEPLEYLEMDERSQRYYKASRKWCLVYDLDYERKAGNLKEIKEYIILDPERYFNHDEPDDDTGDSPPF